MDLGGALGTPLGLTVVLEKTLESPLDCKEIQPVHPKGDQCWVFIGRRRPRAFLPPPTDRGQREETRARTDPSPLRGTPGSSLRSPAEGEGHEGFPPPPDASSAKTRGFHTQLDEGPETP